MSGRTIIGASNSDTALKIVAKTINDELKHTFSHFLPSLNLCPENNGVDRDLVSISTKSISDDIEELFTTINHKKDDSLLPQIIIGKSNEIVPSRLGRESGKFKFHKEFKFVNEADSSTIILRGQSFSYESPIQIIILARAGFEVTSLGLAIINILTNNKRLTYDVFAQSETQKYRLKDITAVKVLGADIASFSESTEKYKGYVAIATELNIQHEYLMLTANESTLKSFKIIDSFGNPIITEENSIKP